MNPIETVLDRRKTKVYIYGDKILKTIFKWRKNKARPNKRDLKKHRTTALKWQ